MNIEDEKDLQQILFLTGRILERQHLLEDVSPRSNTLPKNNACIVIPFPLRRVGEKVNTNAEHSQKENALLFSNKEISNMPKSFRKIFRTNKHTAHVRKKDGNVYEIRMQRNGYRITASAKFLDVAKTRFIEKLRLYELYGPQKRTSTRALFLPYVSQWLDTVKKPFVKSNTYAMYLQTFNAYIVPTFNGRTIQSLTQLELQRFINEFVHAGKNRTAKKVALLLSAVLDYAVDDGIIERSPMKRVIVARYEQERGRSLTIGEEKELIQAFLAHPTVYAQAYVFILYTGIRRGELASVFLDNGWVTVITGKQRKGVKPKRRRIPLSPMLQKFLPIIDIEAVKRLPLGPLTNRFKAFCPAHHLHDLRHTFITRAQECGIKRELVSLWAGHAADSSITSNVYTHLEQNEERQLAEMALFFYDLS